MKTRGADPNWTYEEHLLALDLYHRAGRRVLAASDAQVVQLSKQLRSMDLHPEADRKTVFRSPDSVSRQLKNYRSLEAGGKLDNAGNIGKLHQVVWRTYDHRSAELRMIAAAVERALVK